MPNHCYNEVKAKKEILDEIFDYEKGIVTFNKIIPMPKDLEESVADGSTKIKKAMYLFMNGDKDLLKEKWENNQGNFIDYDKIVIFPITSNSNLSLSKQLNILDLTVCFLFFK